VYALYTAVAERKHIIFAMDPSEYFDLVQLKTTADGCVWTGALPDASQSDVQTLLQAYDEVQTHVDERFAMDQQYDRALAYVKVVYVEREQCGLRVPNLQRTLYP
jgi:hypothetical protein